MFRRPFARIAVLVASLAVSATLAVVPADAPTAQAAPLQPSVTVTMFPSSSTAAVLNCNDESAACFNSCTMGVDGRYPDTDPRYSVPGPCDLSAALPNWATFRLDIAPATGRCGEGTTPTRITVSVVATDGTVLVTAVAVTCAPAGNPGDSDVIPALYRTAATVL